METCVPHILKCWTFVFWNFEALNLPNCEILKLWNFVTKMLFYFQVRESRAPLNIPTPTPAPDHPPQCFISRATNQSRSALISNIHVAPCDSYCVAGAIKMKKAGIDKFGDGCLTWLFVKTRTKNSNWSWSQGHITEQHQWKTETKDPNQCVRSTWWTQHEVQHENPWTARTSTKH